MYHLFKLTEKGLLDKAEFSEAEYYKALENMEKKTTVLYKRRPC